MAVNADAVANSAMVTPTRVDGAAALNESSMEAAAKMARAAPVSSHPVSSGIGASGGGTDSMGAAAAAATNAGTDSMASDATVDAGPDFMAAGGGGGEKRVVGGWPIDGEDAAALRVEMAAASWPPANVELALVAFGVRSGCDPWDDEEEGERPDLTIPSPQTPMFNKHVRERLIIVSPHRGGDIYVNKAWAVGVGAAPVKALAEAKGEDECYALGVVLGYYTPQQRLFDSRTVGHTVYRIWSRLQRGKPIRDLFVFMDYAKVNPALVERLTRDARTINSLLKLIVGPCAVGTAVSCGRSRQIK
jgi:hypothetical protein